MKKTIRLTESDLVRLVKRIIKEQDLNANRYNNVAGCLKQNGYKLRDTGGKYDFSMIKDLPGGRITIDSQEDPFILSVRSTSFGGPNERIITGGEFNFKNMSCNDILAKIKELNNKRIN